MRTIRRAILVTLTVAMVLLVSAHWVAEAGQTITASETSPPAPSARPIPTIITIPNLLPDTTITPVAADSHGSLQVPHAGAGWWSAGPRPGDPGWAILVGHTKFGGGGAFQELAGVRVGMPVVVNGSERYRVVRVVRVRKSAFAEALAHAPGGSGVVLITCAGPRLTWGGLIHRDNLLVFAAPSG